ncbi:Hypothetical protein Bdt_1324 [Bdellovibrio bacteriovorus str. Tiberius]|uniref:Uncharacterized protein n=1 Tax=Bdellovibrio bacteriovorus str. Tiberius TaxID=1069642 RepID=K7ZF09_BDEBC|nr:Hypothetical protein Bdt_1324 [Bdellovibrio bacteriovorus str. Tiberius]
MAKITEAESSVFLCLKSAKTITKSYSQAIACI